MKRAQERDRQRVFDHLREIFEVADEDGSGTLSLQEVQKAIDKPEICTKLRMIEFPVEDPKSIFMLLDFNNTGELSIDDFIAGCIRMKGVAKSKDLLAAQVAVDTMKRHYTFFEGEMRLLQKKIALLDDTSRALVYQGEHVFLNLREYRMRHPELEGGSATPPRINTTTIDHAPWELLPGALEARLAKEEAQLALKNSQTVAQKQQQALTNGNGAWNQASNQIEVYGGNNSPSGNQMELTMYNGGNSPSGGERCQQCGEPFDAEDRKFCTKCGAERMHVVKANQRNDQLALPGSM